MHTTIIKLNTLTDPVRATAKNDNFCPVAGVGFTFWLCRNFICRIHIGGVRGKFGSTGVNPLIDRHNAGSGTTLAHIGGFQLGQLGQPCIGESHRFNKTQYCLINWQAVGHQLVFDVKYCLNAFQKPVIPAGDSMHLINRQTAAQGGGDTQHPIRHQFTKPAAKLILARGRISHRWGNRIQPGQANFHRTQRFLQTFLK